MAEHSQPRGNRPPRPRDAGGPGPRRPPHASGDGRRVPQGGPRYGAGNQVNREEAFHRPAGPLTPYDAEHLVGKPLGSPEGHRFPTVIARSPTWQPFLFRKMIASVDPKIAPGEMVRVVYGNDTLGFGLYNPRAEMTVRLLRHGLQAPDLDWWTVKLQAAAQLRRTFLKLDESTTAYRVIHAEADGFPGLMVDRFGDTLSVEAFSLGMYQRAGAILDILGPMCGTTHGILRSGPATLEQEGFTSDAVGSDDAPTRTVIEEFGTRFRVDFAGGHKTGFFCDQRDNRKQLAGFCAGKSVLDLCCYTGGFSVQAKVLGKAAEVTGVDLDEEAIALAKENANLNQTRIQFAQADAFAYLRDMQRNQKTYDVVVLDPPKLIRTRDEFEEGKRKYYDLNRLAMSVVNPGGLLLTCSCSGLLSREEFRQVVGAAAGVDHRVQILDESGASADHPVLPLLPETGYLKTMWVRVG